MRNIVKHPSKLKHIAPIVDYLKHCGGEAIEVSQNGHVYVGWSSNGQPLSLAMPSSPRCVDNAIVKAKQLVRRKLREVGVEMRA